MKRIYWIAILFLVNCNSNKTTWLKLEGKTMGTTYHVSCSASPRQADGYITDNLQADIDTLLAQFNRSVSTYIPASTISRVNRGDTLIEVDDYFVKVFLRAKDVSEKTNGAFDATVMPLVNAWGFGFADTISLDSSVVDSLRQLADYRKVNIMESGGKYFVVKLDSRIQVDFSAIAKGYGVDLLAVLLEKNGIENYMVEIGGEVRTKGKNETQGSWRIGIEKPVDDASGRHQELKDILKLENKSLATSGNYRNFYYRNGKKISHEIDPATGYPALNNLLSATVIASDCMTADAFATAFMVMGMDKTMNYLRSDTSLQVYLVFADEKGEMKTMLSKGMAEFLVEEK